MRWFGLLSIIVISGTVQQAPVDHSWAVELAFAVEQIDQKTQGELGLYIQRVSDDSLLKYHADRTWYLASTTKVLVAIAILQRVDAGEMALEQEIELRDVDRVDGAGKVRFRRTGSRLKIAYLLEQMLVGSDSTAADLLIRSMGEMALNSQIREKLAPDGFGPITTLLQVRYDAYAVFHPRAVELTNHHFIELRSIEDRAARLERFREILGLGIEDLGARSIDEGFERYYQTGLNSGTLSAFGSVLRRLVNGELLSAQSTELLLKFMESMSTGEKRMKAGFPEEWRFAQKTGSQINRMCNVGILRHSKGSLANDLWVIAACLEKFRSPHDAERAFREMGAEIARVFLAH